ncbi:hypothetical protein [Robertmurraya sp. Marseille-Q9965]
MKKYDVGFVIAGSIMTILFLTVTNFLTSTEHLWFIYPGFLLLLFPICSICILKKQYKLLSVIGSLWILIFLIVVNYLNTPELPWVLYVVAPVLMWPILIMLGKKAKTMFVALSGCIGIILYYVCLNLFLSPQYPWAIFPAFVVIWWPLMLYHLTKKTYYQLSVHGSVLISVFFITVNVISTPNNIWAVYPIFTVLWWPLSMYYFGQSRRSKG